METTCYERSRSAQSIEGIHYQKERIEELFLEKCVRMLREGGKMGLILPDGILGNEKNRTLRKWLLSQGKILAIIDLPEETFMPYTSVKTSAIIFEKTKTVSKDYHIFMAIADTCGHDRRGKEIPEDDFRLIAQEYKKWKNKN